MNANELRIGNLIYKCYPDGNEVIEVGNISENFVNSLGISSIKSIQLTEEWLLKFGFSDKEYKKDYIGKEFKSGGMYFDFVLSKPFSKGEWNNTYTFNLENHRFCKVEHVHSLQNLYFELTGEELTIKK